MGRELVPYSFRATRDVDDEAVEGQVREVKPGKLQALATLSKPGMMLIMMVMLMVATPVMIVMMKHWSQIDGALFTLMQFILYSLYVLWACAIAILVAQTYRFVTRKPMRVVRHHADGPVAGIEVNGQVIQPMNFHPQPLSQVRSLSINNNRQGSYRDEEDEPEQSLLTEPQLRPVTFREVAARIPTGQQLLGVRADGSLRLGTLEADKLTTLYLGKTRSGKTVSAASEIGTEVRNGALLMVADPHEHKPDSLAKKIGPLSRFLFPGTSVVSKPEDILGLLQMARYEMARRRQGGSYDRDLVVVIEEYGLLFDDPDLKQELLALSKELTREGRGFRMYGKFLTQQMSGGMSAQVRKLAASYVIHRTDHADAFAILHDSDLSKQAMQLAPGSSIVVDASGERELLQQPHITAEDIALLAQQAPRPALMYQDYAHQYQMSGSDDTTNVYPQMEPTRPTTPQLAALPAHVKTLADLDQHLADITGSRAVPKAPTIPPPAPRPPIRLLSPEERLREKILDEWYKAQGNISRYVLATNIGVDNNKALPGGIIDRTIEAEKKRLAAQQEASA